MPSDLEGKAAEMIEGMDKQNVNPESVQTESPIEEARRLNKEIKENLEKVKAERERFNNEMINNQLLGRSFGGQPPKVKTQDDLDQEAADRIIKAKR